jgi:hypothetical protein
MIGRTDGRRSIERACRNDYSLAVASYTRNRAAAATTKPFSEAIRRGQIIASDDVLTRQPGELVGITDQICSMTRAGALAAPRTMAMDHSRERRAQFECDSTAEATAVNVGFSHTSGLAQIILTIGDSRQLPKDDHLDLENIPSSRPRKCHARV